MRWQRGDNEAIQVLESQMKKVRVGRSEKFVEEFKFKDPRDLALKAMAEIRFQLKLQLDLLQTFYDLRTVQDFQQEVLETIGNVSKETRDEIIKGLREKRALRSAVRFD